METNPSTNKTISKVSISTSPRGTIAAGVVKTAANDMNRSRSRWLDALICIPNRTTRAIVCNAMVVNSSCVNMKQIVKDNPLYTLTRFK